MFLCHIHFKFSSHWRRRNFGCLENRWLLIFSIVRYSISHTTHPEISIPTSGLSLCTYVQIFRLVLPGPAQTIMAFLQADQSNPFHVPSPNKNHTMGDPIEEIYFRKFLNICFHCFGIRIMLFRCLDTVWKSSNKCWYKALKKVAILNTRP